MMRERGPVSMISLEDLAVPPGVRGELLELTRAQETELPQALKWQLARADEEYDTTAVEATRATVEAARVKSESFPVAVPPEEAERRCRRALMKAWTGRETATFLLPPSRLALDPGDVIQLEHDGRLVDYRLVSVADAVARAVEAVRQDRAVFDLTPSGPRDTTIPRPVVFGAPEIALMDLPQQRRQRLVEHSDPRAGGRRVCHGAFGVLAAPAGAG